nr:WW domain-containing protein [Ipomoea batatas]
MVSFHSPQWQKHEFSEGLSNKRKRGDEGAKDINSLLGNELPLMAPLPLEWQRCLDIKSGQVYFFNTRTQEKTSRDPRLSPEPVPKSLDLELNLLCGSSEKHNNVGDNFTKSDVSNDLGDGGKKKRGGFLSLARSPSWLTFDGDQQAEMVTAVCKKCHMLVMVCKSSPTCPNCKFVNLPDQKSPTLSNQRPSLYC